MKKEYVSVKELADEWNVSSRNIRHLCQSGRLSGAAKVGNSWIIPAKVEKPCDLRITSGEYKNWRNMRENK